MGARENDRVLNEAESLFKKEEARNSRFRQQQGKNPEVQMKPLARGSTLVGHPEREEPEQPGRVEGNCEISLYVKQYISAPNDRESVRDFAPAR